MSPTILIVDDQRTSLSTLEALLSPEGYQLFPASSGAAVFEVLEQMIPELILLDVMMPGMDGYEVCQRIRTDKRWRDIPVIFITGLDDFKARLQGLEVGADDFISKPFQAVELLARVRNTLKLNHYRRQLGERQKFEWAVMNSDDGFVLLDGDGRLQFANPTARHYLDLAGDEAWQGKALFDCCQGRFLIRPETTWQEISNQDSFILSLIRPETSLSKELWLRLSAQRMQGPEVGWLLHCRDVTVQQLERRQQAVFATLIQHKMRTPMNGLLMSLAMLGLDGRDFTPEESAEMVAIMKERATCVHRQLENIFSYLEFTGSYQGPDPATVADISLIARQLYSELSVAELQLSVADALTEARPEAPQKLALRRTSLEVILMELMENSVKFHPQHQPRLAVEITPVSDKQVRLSVSDDGPGIPSELRARIWEPFVQVEKYFTGQVPGLGLGLATVAELVWAAGGNCRAQSGSPFSGQAGLTIVLDLPLQ
ncbi:response regulator [Leptolyngbya sp. FACHB-261]|uniref:response regulator n=1 Tax=Leptolyngbya sp. FACHB-261 TaxID=2692806 RepID=UPI001684E34B|nr:response regulator [Leptolyngbya sp. FACHB-261]